MNRTPGLTDLFALTGILAAIGGIFLCLFLLFHPFAAGATVPDAVTGSSMDLQISMRWIQPMLGYAIVEDALIKQQYAGEIGGALEVPGRATLLAVTQNGVNSREKASLYAISGAIDHATRVQWVMGRLIVGLTRHRVRAGMVIADRLAEEENQRIVTIARQAGREMDDAFRSEWNAKLGRGIASQTLNHTQKDEYSRDRVESIF